MQKWFILVFYAIVVRTISPSSFTIYLNIISWEHWPRHSRIHYTVCWILK